VQAASESVQQCQLCIEAVTACLYIMTAPGMPASTFQEEQQAALVDALKYHLQVNVYSFYDTTLRKKYRPSALSGAPPPTTSHHLPLPLATGAAAAAAPAAADDVPLRTGASICLLQADRTVQ
jgi:hypothetical protein